MSPGIMGCEGAHIRVGDETRGWQDGKVRVRVCARVQMLRRHSFRMCASVNAFGVTLPHLDYRSLFLTTLSSMK